MDCKSTMEEQNHLYSRHRAVLSCLSCHKQKRRCNRDLPCQQCCKRRITCEYQNNQRLADEDGTGHGSSEQMSSLRGNSIPRRRPNKKTTAHDSQEIVITSELFQLRISQHRPSITQVNPRDFQLMTHFVLQLKPRLATFCKASSRFENDWLSSAAKHPASFYAILYCGGTIYAKEVRKLHNIMCPLYACLPYKNAALNAINKHLAENSQAAVTDEMLLAILILMNFDSAMEDLKEYEVHLDGLRRMIDLRGGLGRLGYDGLLSNWYQWCIFTSTHSRRRAVLSDLQDFRGDLIDSYGLVM